MQEVTIRLKFNRVALGFAPQKLKGGTGIIYRMPRSHDGRIIFLSSWWKERFEYAAKVANSCGHLIGKLDWSSFVDGRVFTWKRTVTRPSGNGNGRKRYALHEAFRPGDSIGVTVVLPDGMTLDAFHELLTIVGTYKGMSPFQSESERYGTFDVVSVTPTVRAVAIHA